MSFSEVNATSSPKRVLPSEYPLRENPLVKSKGSANNLIKKESSQMILSSTGASLQVRTKASDNSTLLTKAQMAPSAHGSSKFDLDWLKLAVSKAIVLKYKSSSSNLKQAGWAIFSEKGPSNYHNHFR